MLVLKNYVFILHNTREVMIVVEATSAALIGKTFNYKIDELP